MSDMVTNVCNHSGSWDWQIIVSHHSSDQIVDVYKYSVAYFLTFGAELNTDWDNNQLVQCLHSIADISLLNIRSVSEI